MGKKIDEYKNNENDGTLSVSVDSRGKDNYDFKLRAALVRQTKEELGLKNLEPLPSPWTLEIEPTLNCNARCHFCSYAEDRIKFIQEQKRGKEVGLSKEIVMKTLEAVKNAKTTKGIFWSGGGEPLIWPHFSEAVKFAATFSDISLQTNGIFLNKCTDNPKDLSLFKLILISVYADDAKMHSMVTGVNSFNRVVKNISDAVLLKKKYCPNLFFGVKIMIDSINYRNLPNIVKFYANLGVNSIGLRLVQDYNYGGIGPRKISVKLTEAQKNELAKIIELSDYKNPSLQAFSRNLTIEMARPIKTQHCYNAIDGHFACIDAWGNVYIGNPEIGNKKFQIGNINETPWEKIWKSDTHYKVLNLMDKMQQNESCSNELCRHVKANIGAQEYLGGKLKCENRETIMKNLGAFL